MEATMGRHLKPLPCGKPEKLSRRAIRALPLRVRQERYEKEKQELFFQIRDLSRKRSAERIRRWRTNGRCRNVYLP